MSTPLAFILFSRSSCSLCEAMEDELRPFIEKYKITVTRQYIDNEPALEVLYGTKVPVLALCNEGLGNEAMGNETSANETLCEYFLDSELLTRVIVSKQGNK